MKNLIYIPALDGYDKTCAVGLDSWKLYCEKYNLDIVISTRLEYNIPLYHKLFHQYLTNELVDLEYDKLLVVDADTMIRWDAPNIFDLFKNHTFSVVKDVGQSGAYHLKQWSGFISNIKTPPHLYFNSGVILLNKTNYLKLKTDILPFYEYYMKSIDDGVRIDAFDQTPTNIIAYDLFPNEIQYLHNAWNNMIMFKYEDYSFINDSYIWHFTGPKMGGWSNREYLMNDVWKLIKNMY
jgi:hypothetical protein